MRPWVLGFWCALVLGGSLQGMAQQQQSGPRTLEGLLNSGEAQAPTATAEAAKADAIDAGPKRPAGTVARPKNGVQHPDLDKAWADYDAAVSTAAESISAAINKQFDAATAKGDLDEAEKWQNAQEKFEKAGEVPLEKETKTAVSDAVANFKKARDELAKAYEAVVKGLTTEKKIDEAKVVRAEQDSILSIAVASPPKAVASRPKAVANDALVGTWLDGLPDGVTRIVFPNLDVQEIYTKTRKPGATGKARRLADGRFEVLLSHGWTTYYRLLSPNEVEFQAIDRKGKAQARVILTKQ